MAFLDLTNETWLDLTVNLIPLGILAFMEVMFIVITPWSWDPVMVFFWHFLTVFPLVVLAVVTYISGRIIQRDEGDMPRPE